MATNDESRPGGKPLSLSKMDEDGSARVMLDVEDDETRQNRLSMLLTHTLSFPLI